MNKLENSISDREKAVFELGIKLGSLFHQFIGTPVSSRTKNSLEKSIEESISNQPFVNSVKVNIEAGKKYNALKPEQIKAKISILYNETRAKGEIEYIEGKDYPLMQIDEVKKVSQN
ncbi:MAG: Dihydroneopterin aldolase, FolB [Candidatus Methanohalarchaeum thermophilum]|uniref:Dihydroneopterin aldolase n=1 Tax=Methanohalarchaeum thermophilum TaxID=1903181 RepID=A0A1Q6DW26_METT1|nr:MAG: Dihydroneopterin aldolase, FolB [Candidatus Methanohalarchaeum thermophilum]